MPSGHRQPAIGRSVVRLQPTPTAAAQARSVVRRTCAPLGEPQITDEAVLLTSELVTNAVVHGCGLVTLAVDWDERGVAVAVGDQGDGRPAPLPLDPEATHGRGLHIVSSCATAWGVRDGDGGDAAKFVWFSLPRGRPGVRGPGAG